MSSLGAGEVVSQVTEALRHSRTGEWQYSAMHSKPQHYMQVVGFTSRPIYTRENSSQRPLGKRLGQPQIRTGRGGEDKSSCPCQPCDLIPNRRNHSRKVETTALRRAITKGRNPKHRGSRYVRVYSMSSLICKSPGMLHCVYWLHYRGPKSSAMPLRNPQSRLQIFLFTSSLPRGPRTKVLWEATLSYMLQIRSFQPAAHSPNHLTIHGNEKPPCESLRL